ncbi:MAG: enolase C-terminal domain-like protein, partial [Bacteriovoracaceae bacterium]
MNITLEKIHLPLKVNWKLSRNETTFKENFIVTLESEGRKFRSEIAPNIRYGETHESIVKQFESWKSSTDYSLESLGSGLHHSLRFGLESVLLAEKAHKTDKSLADYLGLKPWVKKETSFSMPIIPVGEIKEYIEKVNRFQHLKIKVNQETATEMLLEVAKHSNARLRVDGNEAWKDFDEFMRFQEKVSHLNISMMEQPFPSSCVDEYKRLKPLSKFELLADESIEDVGDFNELSQQFHSINIKLMKTGSLIRAKDFIDQAKT